VTAVKCFAWVCHNAAKAYEHVDLESNTLDIIINEYSYFDAVVVCTLLAALLVYRDCSA